MEGKEEEVSLRKGRKAIKVKPKGHDVDQWNDWVEEKAESSRTSRQDSHNCPRDARESQRQKKKKSQSGTGSTNSKSSNSEKVERNVRNVESFSELLRYEVSITENALPGSSAALQSEDAVHQRSPNKDIHFKIFLWLVPRIQRDWAQHNPNDRLEVYHNRSQIVVNRRLNSKPKFIPFKYQVSHQELEDGPSEISYTVVIADAELKVNIPQLEIALDLNTSTEPDDLNICEQLYNITLKNIGGKVCLPCRKSFDFKKRGDHGLKTRRLNGLFDWQEVTAVHTTQSSWINIGIKGCRYSQSVNDTVKEVLGDSPSNWKDVRTWRKREFRAVSDFLKFYKVRIEIDGEIVDKLVRDILRLPAADVSIRCPEFGNKNMTAPQYYWKKFGIKVENNFGLMLQIGETANVPAELCTVIESHNPLLTKNIDDNSRVLQTTQTPRERRERRIAAIDDLLMTDHPILKDFPFKSVPHLELEETRMKKDEIFSQSGEWDHWDHEVRFFDSVVISSWAILILDDTISNIRPENFIRVMQKVGKEDGMNIPDPIQTASKINIQDTGDHKQNVANIADILIKWKKEFKWTTNMNTFIIVVLPYFQCSLYGQTKDAAGLDAGVFTECIIKENFEQADPNVVKNFLLKLKCQLGGNHVAVIPKDLVKVDILKTPVMIVGININTHFQGKGSTISKLSFVVVTASTDRSGMPYLMNIQAQQTKEGAVVVVQGLEIIIEKMLKQFMAKTQKQNNGIPITPSKIIVYRDVFGGERFPEVLVVEMRAIRKACKNFQQSDGKPYRPQITIITVEKRQKVRFILQKRDKYENAPPGTVVDTAQSDFYFSSYKDAQVTSVPTHYQILWDDSNFSADEIQILTSFLCNMYSFCNKAVSYPAPTYYAQRAAK